MRRVAVPFVLLLLAGCAPQYTHATKTFTEAEFEHDFADCRTLTLYGTHRDVEKCLTERYGWTRVK